VTLRKALQALAPWKLECYKIGNAAMGSGTQSVSAIRERIAFRDQFW
jgi:hypothetical protein